MVEDRIERETHIAAPVERVWELLTRAEHIGTWFGDAGAAVDLRPGGRMALTWTEHGTHYARFEAIEPPRRLAYRWVSLPDLPERTEPEPGNSTLVELTLAEAGDGTLLRVVESGFSTLAAGEDVVARHREGNVRGWAAETNELREYAERMPV